MLKEITIEALLEMPEKNLIDIRNKEQFKAFHVPGAKNIPEIGAILNAAELFNKNESYYIICNMGGSSLRVTEALTEQGYDVTNVIGGTNAYILMDN